MMLRNFHDDIRYDIMRLAVARDAAGRIGADYNGIIARASLLGTTEAGNLLVECGKNTASVYDMGYIIVEDETGIKYVQAALASAPIGIPRGKLPFIDKI